MKERYRRRVAGDRLRSLLATFPVVLVHGPRQSGKSTFVRHELSSWDHLDLERPADLAAMSVDLEGFFDMHSRRLVVDEAQRLPELFPVLRHVVDRSRATGRYVLLGSASPPLLRTASESLAGRIGLLELTPFMAAELADPRPSADRWFWGGYPRIHQLRGHAARAEWFDAYVSTFLERDLPNLGLSLPPARLRRLWTMLTHVHGQLLNVSDLARSLAVSSHTVDAYLEVLEATFMVRLLRPFFANVQKRLTKAPKVYVRDSGLLHFLAGLRTPRELDTWARRGSSFEGLVVEELATRAALELTRPQVHFWRTQAGGEVDVLIVNGRKILPVEIKLGSSIDQYAVAGLRQCMKDLSLRRGWVVCTGKQYRPIGGGIEIVPWDMLKRREIAFDL